MIFFTFWLMRQAVMVKQMTHKTNGPAGVSRRAVVRRCCVGNGLLITQTLTDKLTVYGAMPQVTAGRILAVFGSVIYCPSDFFRGRMPSRRVRTRRIRAS